MDTYQKIDLSVKVLIFVALVVIIYYLYNIESSLNPIEEYFITQNSIIEGIRDLL